MFPWPLKPPSQGLRGLGWRGPRVQVPRVSSCRSTFAFLVRRPRGSNLMQPQNWILTQAPSYTLSQRVGDSSKEVQTEGPVLKLGDVRPGARARSGPPWCRDASSGHCGLEETVLSFQRRPHAPYHPGPGPSQCRGGPGRWTRRCARRFASLPPTALVPQTD